MSTKYCKIIINNFNQDNMMMRHMRYNINNGNNNRSYLENHRKSSLNVVLPPLSPTFLENGSETLGNVWVSQRILSTKKKAIHH